MYKSIQIQNKLKKSLNEAKAQLDDTKIKLSNTKQELRISQEKQEKTAQEKVAIQKKSKAGLAYLSRQHNITITKLHITLNRFNQQVLESAQRENKKFQKILMH